MFVLPSFADTIHLHLLSTAMKNLLEIKAANGITVKLACKTLEEKTDLLKVLLFFNM